MNIRLPQYCAKVMRTNFALCSLRNIAELFDRFFAAFATIKRSFGDNSPSQAIPANRKIASSNFQPSEISMKIHIKSNEISANFLTARETPDKWRQNVNNHFSRVLYCDRGSTDSIQCSIPFKKQEILKNLQAAHSLSPLLPPPPSPVPMGKRFNFSSSWFPVTCYGQFALPVCKELNVCRQLENFVCL